MNRLVSSNSRWPWLSSLIAVASVSPFRGKLTASPPYMARLSPLCFPEEGERERGERNDEIHVMV